MDLEKLNIIRKNTLSIPLEDKKKSNDFIGLYVDGTGKLAFEEANPAFHAFKVFSQYDYTVYLFVSMFNNQDEIRKITEKYSNIKVIPIKPLNTPELYNEFMFNTCFRLLPLECENIYSFQGDGFPIQQGLERFIDYDMIGAPWRSEIEVLSKIPLNKLKICNGGVSKRKLSSMLKCIDYVDSQGGQSQFFTGIKIDGQVCQQNSWLAEDAMFCAMGFTLGYFKELKEEDAKKFSIEPITLSLYRDKTNIDRPVNFHKIDE